jgi:hypothetical protein
VKALGILALATGCFLIFLTWVDVAGVIDIPIDLIITLAVSTATLSICHVVALVGNQVADRMHCEHGEMRDFVHTEHTEFREALAGLDMHIDDYVDRKVIEDRIATMRAAGQHNGHDPSRLRSVTHQG